MQKFKILATLPVILIALLISSCDSPTETKAVSISAPSLDSPPDNATGISLTPTFKWTGNADKLEIATNTTFASPLYSGTISGNEFTLPGGLLQSGHVYFWRAGVTSGNTVYWSSNSFRFSTN